MKKRIPCGSDSYLELPSNGNSRSTHHCGTLFFLFRTGWRGCGWLVLALQPSLCPEKAGKKKEASQSVASLWKISV
jgi:hypothetical protein